ncbi:MAG: hypothetical protein ACHQF0_12885 [Chitinophagales bacterium]
MTSKSISQKMLLFASIVTTAVSSYAQQHFTLTCNNSGNTGGPLTRTTGSRECNSACALIYSPPLDDKAILLATSSNANSRLLGVWWKKVDGQWVWNVNYQDAKTMNYGEQFDVVYFANPDPNYQFVHQVYQPGTTQTIYTSYIDHINLNGNPNANFRYIANGNGTNLYPVTFKYDPAVSKWYLYNTNGKALDIFAAYNIVIDPTNAFGKSNIIVDTTNPKIITKPIDTIPVKKKKPPRVRHY